MWGYRIKASRSKIRCETKTRRIVSATQHVRATRILNKRKATAWRKNEKSVYNN